jgi:GT2 family glycosyltransferase
MPSYNHAHFIRAAIDSVLSQNYPHLDLLVMDGGSTDGTLDILKSYGDKISFVSQKDKGQSDAINQGLARVQGDIVCWLNSDDLFTPQAIQAVVNAFEQHPEVDFVYGNGWAIDENGGMLGDSGVLPFDLWKLIHQRNFIQQPSCFFRKSLIAKVGAIDESLHYVMDWELWIRFAAYKGLYIKEYLSSNRTYPQNKTQSGYFKRWREINTVVRKYTNIRWPPILTLYLLEISVLMLRARGAPRWLEAPLAVALDQGMRKEMSGCNADGSLEPKFQFSVGNPCHQEAVMLRLSPLSAFDQSRLGKSPVIIRWQSSSGQRGIFSLQENGQTQWFTLPLDATGPGGFTHFRCQVNLPSRYVRCETNLPARSVTGYLVSIQ